MRRSGRPPLNWRPARLAPVIARLAPVIAALALVAGGCGGSSSHPTSTAGLKGAAPATSVGSSASSAPSGSPAKMKISSSAFASGKPIPRVYTCDGRGTSPPLQWSGAPDSTRELVLLMRDIDAPGGNFVHWAVAGIAPGTDSVAAGHVPSGGVQAVNSAGSVGYTPPCPPHGDRPHRYLITIFALPRRTGFRTGENSTALPRAGLASGTLAGIYARP